MADNNTNTVINTDTARMTEKQKVKEITDKLEEGLKELFESEKYKSYLSTMSKFHNYSFNNIQLIAMQKPDATLVAGYMAWQKNFERHVNKGEKAIRILAPAPYKIKEERDKLDPVTGEMMFDENGMPQREEVEVKIPAFRVVSVFDVSQTDGKPIPEMETQELLSMVEGYEDFVQALMNVAPVPIGFEDIPGDFKGYFHTEEKRIAVQENMSESQTLKTMVHEVAHSMLHNKEVNRDNVLEEPVKDRNTKEVEAESIAYTVCQHFGIDTSDYSFGYIAGWSSGKDMKELKSFLDTIRKTASELISGIEGQLQELQINREMEQTQDITLLIRNNDLSEYDLLNVRGLESTELTNALLAMNDDDRLSVTAYLESKGAWVTPLADEQTEEVGEYHLDYAYNTDTLEITDFKALQEQKEKANQPIDYTDVIVRISDTERGEYETIKITNMQSEVESALYDILSFEENEWNGNVLDYLEQKGFDYVPIMKSGGLNDGYPQFYDFDVDMAAREVHTASELPATKQAEQLISRMEFHRTVFDSDERNLIMNHAYKLDNMADTTALAYSIAEQKDDISLLMETENMAQAEIDALPDGMIGLSEMHEYGYTWNEMLPLTKEKALELFEHDLPLYVLHEDGSEITVEDKTQIQEHEGIFGIERGDWENERNLRAMQEELSENEAGKETQLLYGSTDKYGIYQLKDNPELRPFHFAGTEALKRMGITKDNFDAVKRENYNLIYVGELSELQRQTKGATLEAVYEKFNIDHPADYKGHSLSVSDIVVLHQDGENTAHFVDSFGFTTLPEFLKEQAPELEAVQEEMQDTSGQDVQKSDLEEAKESPMVYRQSLSHAVGHGEKDLYRASWKLDIECKEAVEEAIRQNFDGMHLNTGAVKPLMEKYGSERIAFVLANTIQQEAWDGRFSRDNKAWASEFPIPENMANGIDLNRELIVSSHPAVLDGFVDMFRKEVMELEKEAAQDMAQEEMRDTSGQSVQKPEPESIEDGDEIIDLGDEREQVLAEMKKAQEEMQDTFGQSVQKPEMEDKEEPHETELAFQIADRYITIQEVESSYDYSIMGADYKEIDGGMYDNPDVGIREALHDIVEDLKSEPDYNGAKGNIREDDELIPMDYDELMEKAEAANRIQPQNTQSSVVEDFKAKTDELFHDISEMNPSEIEETVKCHVQAKIEEYDIDAQIVDVAVVGS